MKKLLVSLLIVLMLSGFSAPKVVRVDKLDIEQTMYTIFPLKIRMHNINGNGYKYYVPRGISKINAKKYNEVLARGDYKYYLYVDVIDYYYKNKEEYKNNDKAYFYETINYNGKKGYLKIEEIDKKMYVDMAYNYARIETYVDKKDLNDTVRDLSYILSSMKFNDSLLKKMYEAGTLGTKEETYKLFDNKESDGNFIEYIEEYDKYSETSN